jgi:hypothetical protein
MTWNNCISNLQIVFLKMVRLSYIILFSILLFSCDTNDIKDVNGTWSNQFFAFEIATDSLRIYPSEKYYQIEIEHDTIKLVPPFELKTRNNDSLFFPSEFGLISVNQGELEINTNSILKLIGNNFKKLNNSNTEFNPYKVQLSNSNAWQPAGFHLELDTNGHATISDFNFYQNHNSYEYQASKIEIKDFKKFLKKVQFDSLENYYNDSRCSDFPRYSICLFSETDTICTYIRCGAAHTSFRPLQNQLEYQGSRNINDTSLFRQVESRAFLSEEHACYNDTLSLIDYRRRFDSVNYQLPKYNLKGLKSLLAKYYKFQEDNICFHIISDDTGNIEEFDFYDYGLKENTQFLKELKPQINITPGIFEGKYVKTKDFECISFYD